MKITKKLIKKVTSKKSAPKAKKVTKAKTNKKANVRTCSPGRPRDTKSANYKLVVSLFGEYISKYDMTKKQLHRYYEGLSTVYVK